MKNLVAKVNVMPGRKIALVALSMALSACRIEVTVPEGGEVATRSGNYVCAAEANCTVQVEDTNFNETFVATPSGGYQFIGWKTGFARLCGGRLSACTIDTSWFASYDNMMALLTSDDAVAYLEPDFIPSDYIRTFKVGDVVIYSGTYSAWSRSDQPRYSKVTVRQEYLPGTRTYLDKTVLKLRTTTSFADTGEKQIVEQHVWQEDNGSLYELTDDYGNDYVTGAASEKGLLSIPVPLVAFYGTVINYYTIYGGSLSGPITEGIRSVNVSEPEIAVVPLAEFRVYPVTQRDSYEYLYTYVDNKSGSRIIIDRDMWISPAKGAVKEVEVRRGYARTGTLETEVRWELVAAKMNF